MKFYHKKEISESTLEAACNLFKERKAGDEPLVSSVFPLEFVTMLNRHSEIKANPDQVLKKWYNESVNPEEEDDGEPPSTRYKDFAMQCPGGVYVQAELESLKNLVVKRDFGVHRCPPGVHWIKFKETLLDPDSRKQISAESNYTPNGTFSKFACTSVSGDRLVVSPTRATWNSAQRTFVEDLFPPGLKEAIRTFRSAGGLSSTIPQPTLATSVQPSGHELDDIKAGSSSGLMTDASGGITDTSHDVKEEQ